ncbi:AMP-binding protein [Streptomyces malaysiensis]|nr:AMP-binding protein [Streptomyces malaysiensis]
MIAYAQEAAPLDRTVRIATGGAPPSPAILRRTAELGFEVTHLYGLTETYGPAMLCDWRPEWNDRDAAAQARLKARQGVGNMISCVPRVIADDGTDVPADGVTTGQIALRGNNLIDLRAGGRLRCVRCRLGLVEEVPQAIQVVFSTPRRGQARGVLLQHCAQFQHVAPP